MEGTRAAILEELDEWANDLSAPRIYWLDGMAGTGKSAIARSFCHILRSNNTLGGSFFCSRRGSAEQGDVRRILPTLAYALCRHNTEYGHALLPVLKRKDVTADSNLQVQLEQLFEIPLKSIFRTSSPVIVFVIDALDECLSKEGTSSILCNLRILITSRPENHIQSVFKDAMINSLGQDMAGIEDETMLNTDVVDLEGNLKGVFPSEL